MIDSPSPRPDRGNGVKTRENGSLLPAESRRWTFDSAAEARSAAAPDPKAILSALRRRWFVALFLGLACGAAGAFAAWQLVPAPYVTFAELRISSVADRLLFKTAEQQARFHVYKQTQMRLIKDPSVLSRVLQGDVKIDDQTRVPAASLRTIQEAGLAGDPRRWLEANLNVRSPATEFINVSLSGEHREELPAIVNAVVTTYEEQFAQEYERSIAARLNQLEKARLEAENALTKLRRDLQQLADSAQAVNPAQADQNKQFLLDLHLQLRKDLFQVSVELERAKIRLAVKQQTTADPRGLAIPEVVLADHIAQQPEIRKLAAAVARQEQMAGSYARSAGPNHSLTRDAQKTLERFQQDLNAARDKLRPIAEQRIREELMGQAEASDLQLQREIDYLEATKQHLERELVEVRSDERRSTNRAFDLQVLTKDIAGKEQIVQAISREIEQLKIEQYAKRGDPEQALLPPRIRIQREAEVPERREARKKYGATGLAGLGLFALVAGGIVWLDVLSKRISTIGEVSGNLSMRVMGALPLMPRSVTNGRSRRNGSRTALWQSVLTESVDATRTMLLREARLESINKVMIASALPGEGKTTLSCHLATSLARAGRRTVLVDCDMRRPTIHKIFERPLSPGLAEVLRGEASLDEVIHSGGVEGLSVIAAGRSSPQVLRILGQDGIGPVFRALGERFDFLIADSSPVLPTTDSLLIAQHVDAVLFSIRRDVSRTGKVMAACQRLSMLGVPLCGAVVIGLDDGSYTTGYDYHRS